MFLEPMQGVDEKNPVICRFCLFKKNEPFSKLG
jgi:hypothetical protein